MANSTISNIFRLETVRQRMSHLESPAVKSKRDVQFVLEEVVRRVHVEWNFSQLWHFGIEITTKIEISQLERIGRVVALVDCDR